MGKLSWPKTSMSSEQTPSEDKKYLEIDGFETLTALEEDGKRQRALASKKPFLCVIQKVLITYFYLADAIDSHLLISSLFARTEDNSLTS